MLIKNNYIMYFLSASIPDPQRDRKYFETSDVIAIRDAVKALATVVVPRSHLIWGGHPAISPFIRQVLMSLNSAVNEHVTMYQSKFFEKEFPKANRYFENVIKTEKEGNKDKSLSKMRSRMLHEDGHHYRAGIFIGGMEGVEDEFIMFTQNNKEALVLPIASSGGAAKIIYEMLENPKERIKNNLTHLGKPDPRLKTDYTYMQLFRSLLDIKE